ncbi:hypothetical protein ACF06P_07880 [Streptomyces sp. NPDC015684]|uniref:hypothetical protein n=1 Tax=Streptomyces sp. NPDC015684 TaxID=3364963 RepID=UPI0036FCEAD1
MHLHEHVADVPAISEVAARHRRAGIEDCAQAAGASLNSATESPPPRKCHGSSFPSSSGCRIGPWAHRCQPAGGHRWRHGRDGSHHVRAVGLTSGRITSPGAPRHPACRQARHGKGKLLPTGPAYCCCHQSYWSAVSQEAACGIVRLATLGVVRHR